MGRCLLCAAAHIRKDRIDQRQFLFKRTFQFFDAGFHDVCMHFGDTLRQHLTPLFIRRAVYPQLYRRSLPHFASPLSLSDYAALRVFKPFVFFHPL